MSYQRNGALLGSKFREYLFPTIISNMSILLASFVDGIIVSKLINDDAFSAVNLAEPVVLFMQALFFLFGIGGAICISIAKGQRDEHKANAVFTLSFIAAIVVSVIVTVVGIVLIDPITHLLCNNNTLFDYVRNYALFNIYGTLTLNGKGNGITRFQFLPVEKRYREFCFSFRFRAVQGVIYVIVKIPDGIEWLDHAFCSSL